MLTRISLIIFSLLLVFNNKARAQAEEDTTESASKTPYERLFEGKESEIARGMITLRKMDGKVYFEFPIDLLEKKMLLGTSVISTSNAGDAAPGERPEKPLCIYFTRYDSTIYMRYADFKTMAVEGATNINSALEKNNIGPILDSFDIKAVTQDSSAFVFDATKIFISGNKATDPFGPYSGIRSLFGSKESSFKKSHSTLIDVAAYPQNITVSSYLSFGISSTFLGFEVEKDRPATYKIKHSLVLLPKRTMRPRQSDPRIGVSSSEILKFSGTSGIRSIHYAHRWELKPKNLSAFKKGKLVEPAEPITFYIDDKFPEKWVGYVKEGVEDWNKAFERIGFKNAIITKPFPVDNPEFSPNNIVYSTINYIISSRRSAIGQSWVDPRSGEILSASVNIYKGTVDKIREDLFIRTAAANKRVRTTDVPDDLMGKVIRDITAHQVGHTLGLTNNLGASSSIPVNSLRSPAFTQKYGITPSIMDEAFYNFVAQPGDMERGVRMTPKDLGVYDYYAIKWLYKPIFAAQNPKDEVPILKQWIAEKIDDSMYRYKKSTVRGIFNPDVQAEDLGDDQVKASRYALSNLAYVFNNMNKWLEGEDEDYSFRTKMNFSIINIQFYWYLRHVLNNIGGIYQTTKYEGDPFPAYAVVPEDVQKESLLFLMETFKDLSWMGTSELTSNMNSINGDASEYMRSILFPYLIDWGIRNLAFTGKKAYENPYTRSEFMNDVFDYVWESAEQGEKPSKAELSMQSAFVSYLIRHSPIKHIDGAAGGNAVALNSFRLARLRLGKSVTEKNWLRSVRQMLAEGHIPQLNTTYRDAALRGDRADINDTFYYLLKKSQRILKESIKTIDQSGKVYEEYQYLLMKVRKSLKVN